MTKHGFLTNKISKQSQVLDELENSTLKTMTIISSDHGSYDQNHGAGTEKENTGFVFFAPNKILRQTIPEFNYNSSKKVSTLSQIDISSLFSFFLGLDLPIKSKGISYYHRFFDIPDKCFIKKLEKHLNVLLSLKYIPEK